MKVGLPELTSFCIHLPAVGFADPCSTSIFRSRGSNSRTNTLLLQPSKFTAMLLFRRKPQIEAAAHHATAARCFSAKMLILLETISIAAITRSGAVWCTMCPAP
jgi:hypothetical protein